MNADLLLIDVRRGRTEANRLGIRITGLLGVLVEAKKRAFIPAVRPLRGSAICLTSLTASGDLSV